jgi:chemotaxis family two-component system response regulator Rcp1
MFASGKLTHWSHMSRIFMAEDNPGDVYMMDLALRESGAVFELEVAYTGKEALAFLEREKESGKPALGLILLDLNLPQHDGTDILRFVRQDPQLNSIPIVLFTSSDSPKDRLEAIRQGANRFIKKPSLLREYMAIGTTLKNMLESEAQPEAVSRPEAVSQNDGVSRNETFDSAVKSRSV